MKKILIFIFFLPLFLATGCSRQAITKQLQSPTNNINRAPKEVSTQNSVSTTSSTDQKNNKNIDKTPAHLILPDQVTTMEELMSKNGRSLVGLQAYRFEKDQLGMTHIRFNFFVNGVLADETIYHFKADDTFSSISNEPDTNLYAHISTTPQISEGQALVIASARTKDSSFVATKIFWNITGGEPGIKHIVLAWKIQPSNNPYPVIIIDAQTGDILYDDNGIRY